MGPLDLCERCETVELWFDPLPKAQLVLVQLLDCLRSHDKIISKLALFQSNVVIGDQPPEALSEWKPPGVMTALGKAVLAQSEDFSRHNPIHRWWGGTELTNGRLWRWDPRFRALVGP